MVQIPKLGTQARISPEVSRGIGPDISRAGAPGRSIQRLGQSIEQLGGFAATLAAKRQKAEDDHYMNTSLNNLQMETTKFNNETSIGMEGTDYKGFAQTVDSNFDEQANRILENAPNDNVKEKLRLQLNSLKTKNFLNNDAFENKKRSQFYISDQIRQNDQQNDFLYSNPDLATAQSMYDDNIVAIESGTGVFYSAEQTQALKNSQSSLAKSTLDGMLTTGGGALLEGKAFLNGDRNDEYKDLFNSLSPAEKRTYSARFDRALKQQQNDFKIKTIKNANNLVALAQKEALENGGHIRTETARQMEATSEALVQFKGEDNAIIAANNLENVKTQIEFAQDIKDLSLTEIAGLDLTVKTGDLAEAPGDLRAANAKRNAVKKLLNLIKEDPGKAILSSRPNLVPGTEDFLNEQISRGYPDPQYLPNKTALQEASLLLNSPNSLEALNNFINRYPENSDKILAQMQKRNKGLSNFVLATHFENPNLKAVMLDTQMKEKLQRFADVEYGGSVSNLKKAHRPEIVSKLSDLEKGFAEDSEIFNALTDRLVLVSAGLENAGQSRSDAVEHATNMVLRDYRVAKASDVDRPIVLPANKYTARHVKDISNAMQAFTEPMNRDFLINTMGINAQKNLSNMDNEEFLDSVMESARMVLNDKGDAMRIMYTNDLGFYQYLGNDVMMTDRGPRPVPVEIPLDELRNTNAKYGLLISETEAQSAHLPTKKEFEFFIEGLTKAAERARGASRARGVNIFSQPSNTVKEESKKNITVEEETKLAGR